MKQKQIRNRLNRGNVRGRKNDRAREIRRRTKLKGGPMRIMESLSDFLGRIATKPKRLTSALSPARLKQIMASREKHKQRRES